MDPSFSQIIAISVVVFLVWKLFHFLASFNSLSHIPGPPRASWWKGNFDLFFGPDGAAFDEELYRNYGGAARLDMLFGDQHLYVSDPLALHYICVKEQDIYEEKDQFLALFALMFGPSLLSTIGNEHKRQRKLLNPVFSLRHIQNLLPVFYPIALKLRDVLENEISEGQGTIDVKDWASRAALEYIGQGGLGYSFNTLDEHESNEYFEALKVFEPMFLKHAFIRQFIHHLTKIGTASFRRRVVELIPLQTVKDMLAVTDTIEQHTKGILQEKRQALQAGDETLREHIGQGKDIMSILMKANMEAGANHVPEKELLAHMSTLIAAAHDTTTNSLSRILHLLSYNTEIQSKLRNEVTCARKERGDFDYDTLMGLPLLDAICRETLRVYPPVVQIERMTRKDTILPLLWPIKSTDGNSEIREIYLKKNTTVYVSIIGANRSKSIWGEDADDWKPERWLKPLPKSVDYAHLPGVYSQMMTFLGGGRACIGFKFAEMELKLVLSILIEKFIFEPDPKIIWIKGGIQHPQVVEGKDAGHAKVPLKMSIVGH